MLGKYSAAGLIITWGPFNLSKGDYGEDTFLDIQPIGDRYSATFSADGQVAPSQMANKGAIITMNFMQTAPINNILAGQIALGDAIGGVLPTYPFSVQDPTGGTDNFILLNAFITSVNGNTYGNAVGERTYVWTAESYLMDEEAASISANLQNYLSF
jgi:hypothetical protein